MTAVSELRQRRAVRISKMRDLETVSGFWSWTVGDDSDVEEDGGASLKTRRRFRRQEAPPPPLALGDAGGESTSGSESDGISSGTSDGEEGEEAEAEDPSPGLPPPPPAAEEPSQLITTSSSSQPTSSSSSSTSATTTVSQSFTTLTPGGPREPVREERPISASRFVTSLTPVLTVVEPETTYTRFDVYTTLVEIEPTTEWTMQWSTTTSGSPSSATRAAQTSGVADPDSSPTPQIIRVHEHPHGLSKDAIHGLMAFGAIGGLMGVLAIAWFFWRRYKKQNEQFSPKKSSDADFARPSRGVRLLARVPFIKDRFANRSWFNIDEPYYKDNANSRTSGFMEKSVTFKSTSAPRLDSQFFAPNQVMGVAVRVQGGDHPPSYSQNSPAGGGLGHHPVASISSVNPQRSNTVRTREPSYPTDANKRASEISSLSSGFGDGDLLMPNGESTMERIPQPPPSAKFSEAATSRRDTVYTEASEDQPPRFRNVNSWVRQQTGRVKRSQARAQAEDAPPVPQMPSEEDYAMMLPDGEEPRRPQDGGK